tara:strand:+ start:35589 stop:35972 length:384 start_codon:yes stop_codon:yes gene_type:complete
MSAIKILLYNIMASTKIHNERIEYNINKKMNYNRLNYLLDNVYENNDRYKMVDLGGNTKLYSSNMSYNNIDIESKLKGINSCNLEGMNFNPEVNLKKIESLSMFKKPPFIVPPSFIHISGRRGFHNI